MKRRLFLLTAVGSMLLSNTLVFGEVLCNANTTHWASEDAKYITKDNNNLNGTISRGEYVKLLLDIVDPGLVKYEGLNLEEGLSDYVVVGGLPGWYKMCVYTL